MKLIIDIPEEDRKDIGNIHFVREDLKFKIGKAIMNGIPLDDVKAEIRELRDSWEKDCYHDEAEALNIALKIIDKHIGKVESEKV